VFSDNTKYLFLHVSNTRPDVRAVWLAKDEELAARLRSRGYRSYHHHSARGIWEALRAGTTVIDAFLQPDAFRWSGGTRLVQLLHGRGMKKKGYNEKPPRNHDYLFVPSTFVEQLINPVFKKGAKISIGGYPRNDVFFREIKGSDIDVDPRAKELVEKGPYKKKIIYAPTFRRGKSDFSIKDALDLEKLAPWLEKNNYLFVMTLHPKYFGQERLSSSSHIYFLPPSDFYPLLGKFDLMINDYSSLMHDFLMLDKPVVFFPFDLKEYSSGEGLAFPYETYTPGPKAYNVDTLLATIESTLANDTYAAERKRVRDTYFAHAGGGAAERITAQLLQ